MLLKVKRQLYKDKSYYTKPARWGIYDEKGELVEGGFTTRAAAVEAMETEEKPEG